MLEQFKDIDLFKGVEAAYLDSLSTVCREITLQNDEYLFKQGDAGKGMYIVVDGEVAILVDSAKEGEQLVAVLKSGSPLGEVSLLDRQKRIASAKARTQCTVLYLDITDFTEHINANNANALRISYNIAVTMVERLERANEILTNLQMGVENRKTQREVSLYKEKLLEEGLF